MATVTLVREPVPGLEVTGDADVYGLKDLAEKAADKLGYTHLRDKVFGDEKRRERNQMIRALAKLDAAPFTDESVNAYKNKKLRDDIPVLRRWFGNTSANILTGICAVCFSLAGVVTVITTVGNLTTGSTEFGYWRFSAIAGVLSFLALVVFIVFMVWGEKQETPAKWKRTPLADYGQPVPEFALATAIEVQEQYPNGKFFVEEFIAGVKKDPFLFFHRNGESYYLHVWNEPDFRGKREV